MSQKIPCSRAHPDYPHNLEQGRNGRWFCPIERDAEMAAQWLEDHRT